MKTLTTAAVGTASTLIAAGALAAPSAQATTLQHRYSSSNITITWGDAKDLDDLSIRETPGVMTSASSSEDEKIGKAILAAYLQTTTGDFNKAQPGLIIYAAAGKPDYCTWSPDSFGKANFKPACAAHDNCYSSRITTRRLSCDNRFEDALNKACNSAFSSWWEIADQKGCNGVAWVYYQAVRKAGKSHYHGKGINA